MERLTSPNINVDPATDRFLHAAIGGKEIDWKQSRDSTLNVLINGPTSNGFGKDIFRKMARDLYGRLKAYEDIAELCGGFDRLRELAEADKDGRVVVLPCKVGDTVYTNNRVLGADNAMHDEICTRRIKGYSGNALNEVWLISNGDYCDLSIFPSEFGKTVFLSREEAEKALAETEGKT